MKTARLSILCILFQIASLLVAVTDLVIIYYYEIYHPSRLPLTLSGIIPSRATSKAESFSDVALQTLIVV